MKYHLKRQLVQIYQTISAWFSRFVELLNEPFTWVLHPSKWRLRWMALFIIFGNPLFYWAWTSLFPQSYESLSLRLIASLLGVILLIKHASILRGSFFWRKFYGLTLFIQFPLLFFIFLYANDFNSVWLGSCVAMVLIYYQTTDWRIATNCILASILIIISAHFFYFQKVITENYYLFQLVFGFSWASAIVSGASSANLLKQNIVNTAFNLGVMAHEIRTPIASISIINHLFREKAHQLDDNQLFKLSEKLAALLKTINYQIDGQIANSKHIQSTNQFSACDAAELINFTIQNYPFKSFDEGKIVTIKIKRNFVFISDPQLFSQVISNLVKNSFNAMYAKEININEMTLTIFIDVIDSKLGSKGRISIDDNGVGIKPKDLKRVLEPFFSSSRGSGHGLGLTFCNNVINACKGQLHIVSTLGLGTSVELELPIQLQKISELLPHSM